MSKFDRVRSSFERAHDDLFDAPFDAEFINTTQGSYDPNTGEITGSTEATVATLSVEIVPPAMDTTVDVDGTSQSWDTSIRFPENVEDIDGWGFDWGNDWGGERLIDVITPLGADSKQPTIVKITDMQDNDTDRFELHGYSYEKGSGMVMCRLVEE